MVLSIHSPSCLLAPAEEDPVKLAAALVGKIGFVHHQSAYLHGVSGRWKNDGKKNDASTPRGKLTSTAAELAQTASPATLEMFRFNY